MSLYHIIFIFLLLGAVVEHVRRKTPKGLFWAAGVLLTVFLCLRFGQGQDYFNYANIYYNLPTNPFQALLFTNVHSELGWKFLCGLFRAVRAPFPALIFAVSLYMMVLFLRGLQIFGGERKMLALFICYHTLYLTYFTSVLRQGIVIATLFGVLLPLLMKRSYIKYCITVCLLALIHSVSLLLLLLPILQNLRLTFKHCVALVVLGFLLGTLLSLANIGLILDRIRPHAYFTETDVSIVAVGERILTFAIVTFCYYVYLQGREPEENNFLLAVYRAYAIGIFLYGILMWSALISSRTVYILKVLEIILVCACLSKCKQSRHIILLYFVLLCSVLYVKNIDSYLEQGQYTNASVMDYPYVTIFNQRDILRYRSNTRNYPFP